MEECVIETTTRVRKYNTGRPASASQEIKMCTCLSDNGHQTKVHVATI